MRWGNAAVNDAHGMQGLDRLQQLEDHEAQGKQVAQGLRAKAQHIRQAVLGKWVKDVEPAHVLASVNPKDWLQAMHLTCMQAVSSICMHLQVQVQQ